MDKENQKEKHKPNFSIRTKVSLLCSIFIIISVTANFIFFIGESKQIIMENTENDMLDLVSAYNQSVTNAVENISDSTQFIMQSDGVTSYISSGGSENASEAENFVSMFTNMNSDAQEISLVGDNGIVLLSSNSDNIGKDLSTESYYTDMKESGEAAQSDVYISSTSGEACITFATPIFARGGDMPAPEENTAATEVPIESSRENEVRESSGAIVIVEKASALNQILSEISVNSSESSHAYLLDSNGNVIYHHNEELIGTKLDVDAMNEVIEDIQSGKVPEDSILHYTEDGKEQVAAYSVIESNRWTLVITAEQSEILATLNNFTKSALIIDVVIAIILTIIAYLFVGTITRPIQSITRLIHKTAELDFREDTSFAVLEKKSDETGAMSRAIAKMREILREMIVNISNASSDINKTAENVGHVIGQVSENASDNSATAQELSASMQEAAATTEVIYGNIETMGSNTKDIAIKASEGTKLSQELMNRALQLKQTTSDASDKTNQIFMQVKKQTDSAIEQSRAVDKINLLTKTIHDIADQTSLLSLNASIEAARAGDAGRGFAVVAGEIGALAEQSSNTVSSINEIVLDVHQAVAAMTASLKQTLEFLEKNVLADYQDFAQVSEQYNTDAQVMDETMGTIQRQVESADQAMTAISGAISEINIMMGESSAGIGDVAEKNSGIVEMSTKTYDMMKENIDYANRLKEMVSQFTL